MKFSFASREEGFDEHIASSIRGYAELLDDVISYSQYFVDDYTHVVDIGCSSGSLLRRMLQANDFTRYSKYVGIEVEQDFYKHLNVEACDVDRLSFFKGDVCDYEFHNCSFVTSIFTLQFTQRSARGKIIENIYKGLNKGGAFIFSEKLVAEDPRIQEIRTFTYYDFKRKTFSSEDIMDKERELRHLLKPNTRGELLSACVAAGFSLNSIDSFWQNHGFTAFIAIK